MPDFDFLIVGQGLAGSTLAWELERRQQRFAVIDRNQAVTASSIAAGLISPVTGQRLATSWRFDELWPIARAFYRQVEVLSQQDFFFETSLLRVLPELDSMANCAQYQVRDVAPLLPPFLPHPAVGLGPAARLDVAAFLDATRQHLKLQNAFFEADINPDKDVEIGDVVRVPHLNLCAKRLIFCRGISEQEGGWFQKLKFEPTKGEILTLDFGMPICNHVVSKSFWLAPTNHARQFIAGSNYERDFSDDQPSTRGRQRIIDGIQEYLPLAAQVVNHTAAIRPTVAGRLPVAGVCPTQPRIAVFNGLGSKGALRAPYVADALASFLVDQQPLDNTIQLNRKTSDEERRLTDVVHDRLAEVVQVGDVAVDATAGNGFDTCFLANLVGPSGQVYAIDIQSDAIGRTAAKIQEKQFNNVTLIQDSHANLDQIIPTNQHGRIAAVVFNLGYLPRGDKSQITSAESTVKALQQSLNLLKPGGMVSVMAYTGHPGGQQEADAVASFLRSLNVDEFHVDNTLANTPVGAPRIFFCVRFQG